jgi:hypothetical protein
MTKKTAAPKRHADHITTTVQLTDRVKRTYSAALKQHAVWVDGEIVAAAHAVNVFWSIVIGNPDNERPDRQTTKFAGIAQTEQQAIAALDRAALALAAA